MRSKIPSKGQPETVKTLMHTERLLNQHIFQIQIQAIINLWLRIQGRKSFIYTAKDYNLL